MATTEAGKSRRDFTLFDSSLREENLAEVVEMESDLAAWTDDHSSRPDPYRLPKSSEYFKLVSICISNQRTQMSPSNKCGFRWLKKRKQGRRLVLAAHMMLLPAHFFFLGWISKVFSKFFHLFRLVDY